MENNYYSIVAVSGGPDSIYLLNKLVLEEKPIVVCHVNYNLRSSSKRDQQIVENFCYKNKIQLHIKELEINQANIKNFQTWARIIRYSFFEEIAIKYLTNILYVGHQKDDFVETAIMQYKKNKKLLFYGIKNDTYVNNLIVKRPLLDLTKLEIMTFLNKEKIEYGIDETNLLPKYTRNQLRLHLTKDDYLKYFIFFQKINGENKINYNLVQTLFSNFKQEEFKIFFFLNHINNDLQKDIIYWFLIENKIFKISSNLINQILKFVKGKNYFKHGIRLTNNYLFLIKNQKFFIEKVL